MKRFGYVVGAICLIALAGWALSSLRYASQHQIPETESQANFAGQTGAGPTTLPNFSYCINLDHDLYFGQSDKEHLGSIQELQVLLNAEAVPWSARGVDDDPAGDFGTSTETAIEAWQLSHGIPTLPPSQGGEFGMAGAKTRAVMVMGCDGMSAAPLKEMTSSPRSGKAPLTVQFEIPTTVSFRYYAAHYGDGSSTTFSDDTPGVRNLNFYGCNESCEVHNYLLIRHAYARPGLYYPKVYLMINESTLIFSTSVTVY